MTWFVLGLAAGGGAMWTIDHLTRPPVADVTSARPVAAPYVEPTGTGNTGVAAPQESNQQTSAGTNLSNGIPDGTPELQAASEAPTPDPRSARRESNLSPTRPSGGTARLVGVPATVVPTRPTFRGSLVIESVPSGAQVFVDSLLIGSTPLTLGDVAAGSRVVRIEANGYQRWASAVRVVANQQTRIMATLEVSRTPRIDSSRDAPAEDGNNP